MQLRTFDVNGSTIGLFTCKDMCIHPTRSVRFILIDSSHPAVFITTPKHHSSPLVFGSSRTLPILNKPARIQSSPLPSHPLLPHYMYSSAIDLVAHELVQGFARAHNVTVISSDR